jgi:Holliday junction resolvase RusA-like endonuclease
MAKPKNRLSTQEEEYNLKYGGLPSDTEGLLSYIRDKYPFSQKSFDKVMERIDQIQWNTVEFVLYLVPKPAPRPRSDGTHFYVKGAAENRKLIKHYLERYVVYTRCEIKIEAYLPTPTSQFSNAEIYAAEQKQIWPIGSCDVDNLMKTYLDMIQGHLLLNDNLVTFASLEKFYSLKPRIEIKIRYQTGFDSKKNEKRVKASKWYDKEFKNEEPPYGNEKDEQDRK